MNSWLIMLPRADLLHCVEVGTFGLNSKQSMGKVQVGDTIICCCTKEKPWKILAIGKAVSELYLDDKAIFKKPGAFFYRFDFRAQRLAPDDEIDFQALVPDLSFVTNTTFWPVYFKGGIKALNQQDQKLILSKLAAGVEARTLD